jgi:ribosomal protein S18 acetylase RimI-like enzyme
MSAAVQIRRATFGDEQALANFNVAMAWETEHKRLDPVVVLSGVQSLLRSPDAGFYLVAQIDARVVACLMVTFEWSDWRDSQFWWIQSVYVDSDHRRQGVFRCLYKEVEGLARATPAVCGLRLYVEQSNEIAQRTYRQLGMAATPYRVFELEFSQAPSGPRPPSPPQVR